jgi:hypothetical protein
LHHQHLARRWFEIVGSNDPRHLAAGTRVEAVRSRNGVCATRASSTWKRKMPPPAGEHVRCFWGIIGRGRSAADRLSTFHYPLSTFLFDSRQAERGACPPKTRGGSMRARSPPLELQCAACAKLADSRLWKPSGLGCSVP